MPAMVVISPFTGDKAIGCSPCRIVQASSTLGEGEVRSRPSVISPFGAGLEVSFHSRMTTSGFFPRAAMSVTAARPSAVRLARP